MTVLSLKTGDELHWNLPQNQNKLVVWEHESMYGQQVKGSLRTIAHLDWMSKRAEKTFGQRIVIIQPPYNSSVAASKGTHDFDACKDYYIPGVDWWRMQRFGRVHGDGAYYRRPSQGFTNHIHGFTLPWGHRFDTKVGVYIDGGVSLYGHIVTSSQLSDYYAHRTALVGHAQDPSWFPPNIDATIFRFDKYLENTRETFNAKKKAQRKPKPKKK